MKRKGFIVLCYTMLAILALGTVALFAVPVLMWNQSPATSMNIWIVDKTVPNQDYREHKGLTWILNHKKIANKDTNQNFRFDKDYYGFFPMDKEHFETSEVPTETQLPDLIYLADTYGVYKDDYFSSNVEGTRSELMYGGLNVAELNSIQKNLGGGNTIIGEFNTASSPTNMENRQKIGEIFRVKWMGWSGRYFKDLTKDVEIPAWAVQDYEKASGEAWNFSGEGIILVADDSRIVVLEKGRELGNQTIYLYFENAFQKEFGIDKNIPYDYWFEMTAPADSTEVLATYHIDLTDEGKSVFERLGLPETFPAIIRSKNTQFTSYYCAGDFADSNNGAKWSHFYGYSKLKSILPFGVKGDNSTFYWRCYVPLMGKILDDIKLHQSNQTEIAANSDVSYGFRTSGTNFQILQNGNWENFFSKGVNIGSSTPGKWFTEFSHDEAMYLRWFDLIADMNANSIRVYTLQSPQFYHAFEYYNRSHPGAPLFLYQEIWPEEKPSSGEYLNQDYNSNYQAEIKHVVDAIHGQANISARTGRASGLYTSDVSPYVAGYLVGRELEPDEVIKTNDSNKNFLYSGKYLYCEDVASPTEAWLAMSCDFVLTYEATEYHWQHPVGIVSWPTLDPKEHDSEWNISANKMLEYNDKVTIDINHISTKSDLKTGFFGAYHIYPNYPDFMNNETSYATYRDSNGVFRYGGYLHEFIQGHTKYPALVAEFGLATGTGNAHENPDGYNHGGLTETDQGQGIVRMMKTIQKEGYAGGLIFEWSDEWAKKTWSTEPFIIPFERNVMWHDATDPEQNYGILAMESNKIKSDQYAVQGSGSISMLKLTADETYLSIEVNLKRRLDFTKESLIIGLDTYNRSKGNLRYGNQISDFAPSGLEFIIQIDGADHAQLLVEPDYNKTKCFYSSRNSTQGIFESMSTLINTERIAKSGAIINAINTNQSILQYGSLENNSHNQWMIEGTQINIRIPWNRISFTDPSNMRVLDDSRTIQVPQKDELSTTISDGILVSGLIANNETGQATDKIGASNDPAFSWESWDTPTYQERVKSSYTIIREFLGTIQ